MLILIVVALIVAGLNVVAVSVPTEAFVAEKLLVYVLDELMANDETVDVLT